MSDDLINKRDTPLDHVIAVAMRGDDKYKRWPLPEMIAGQDEITSLRARLEQAERERDEAELARDKWKHAWTDAGFRMGIEAAARLCDAEMDRLYDDKHEGYGAGLYDEAEGLATDIRALIDTPQPKQGE